MRRREFLAFVGGLAPALAAHAQQPDRPVRIGYVGAGLDNPVFIQGVSAFRDELRKHGFVEGHNLSIEHRSAEQDRPAVFAAAAELARLKIDAFLAAGPELALQAVLQVSRAIPIVFIATNYDPIARGYVKSLAQPGGNVTGIFARQPELAEKQVELLTQAFPDRSRLAVLWDALSSDQFQAAESRARLLGLIVHGVRLENPPYDFEAAFEAMVEARTDMVLAASSPFFTSARSRIAELAIRHRLPSMFIFKTYVEAGGLLSYGTHIEKSYRRAALYVAKILNGASPADLPVEQPATFELAVNLKTARALGVTLTPAILLRADEVIE